MGNRQGKWHEILSMPGTGPPAGARGLCPEGGYQYSVAVYHYARCLALAAKAEGARSAGDLAAVVGAYAEGAVADFVKLRVRAIGSVFFLRQQVLRVWYFAKLPLPLVLRQQVLHVWCFVHLRVRATGSVF